MIYKEIKYSLAACAKTFRKRRPPISENLPKKAKIFPVKALQYDPYGNDNETECKAGNMAKGWFIWGQYFG